MSESRELIIEESCFFFLFFGGNVHRFAGNTSERGWESCAAFRRNLRVLLLLVTSLEQKASLSDYAVG